MNPKTILILSRHHPILITSLESVGYQTHIYVNDDLKNLEIPFSSVVGIVTSNSCYMPKEHIDLFENLKFIGRLGSGMEIIDVEYASTKGITCFSSPEGNANALAEHALGMLLSLLNNIHRSQEELKNGIFDRNGNMGRELYDLKVGIIGYGTNGSQFAKHLSHFGTTIYAFDIEDKEVIETENFHFSMDYNDIIENCDCISFHIPINDLSIQTAKQIIHNMQEPFILINVARGGLIAIDDLFDLLASGSMVGAAIDVWESEPLKSLPAHDYDKALQILSMPNVIGTPHIAGYSHQAFYKMSKIISDKIIAGNFLK